MVACRRSGDVGTASTAGDAMVQGIREDYARETLGTYRKRRGVRIRIEDVVRGGGGFDRAV
jgi:hypothetical protein